MASKGVLMQERPICFQCDSAIQANADMVFEAPCGHDDCSSAVFHAICLFDWRERRSKFMEYLKEIRERWMREHGLMRGDEEEG